MGVIAHLQTVTVNGQRQIQQCVRSEQWYDFFQKLIRPDVIAAPSDRGLQTVRDEVALHEVIAGGFAGAVWAARLQNIRLEAVLTQRDRAVNLVGTDLVETQPQLAGDLEQHVCAAHVGLGEDERAGDALIDVRFSGEVENSVYSVRAADMAQQLEVADVTDDDRDFYAAQILEPARVGQLIQHNDIAVAPLEQQSHEVRADEAAAASDEDALHPRFSCHSSAPK